MEIHLDFHVWHFCLSFVCGPMLCADGTYSISLSKVRKIVLLGILYQYASRMRDSFSCPVFTLPSDNFKKYVSARLFIVECRKYSVSLAKDIHW